MLIFQHVGLFGAYWRFMILKRSAQTVKYYSSTPSQVQNTGAYLLPFPGRLNGNEAWARLICSSALPDLCFAGHISTSAQLDSIERLYGCNHLAIVDLRMWI
jgi:hypothetical protein